MNTPTFGLDDLFRGIIERLANIEGKLENPPQATPDVDVGIELMRAYNAREVAHLLGVKERQVYRIPENELPRVRRAGEGIGYLGVQILRYMHSLPPLDMESMVGKLSSTVEAKLKESPSRPKIKQLHPQKGRKTRVL